MACRLSTWLSPYASVTRRELVAHWFFLPAGLVLGLFAPLSTLFASTLGVDADGLHEITAVVCALIFGVLSFGMLGYSSLAPEVANGRLAFFLARPISAGALWLGRLAARFAVASAAIVAVLLPSLLLGGNPARALSMIYDPPQLRWTVFRRPWHWWTGGEGFSSSPFYEELGAWLPAGWVVLAGGSVLIFSLAHFAGVTLRQRGLWTVFDLVAAAFVWSLLGPTLAAFSELGAIRGMLVTLLAPLLLVAAVGLVGGWVQIRWGGLSRQRSHAALSLLFWGALVLCLLLLRQEARSLPSQPLERYSHLLDVLPAPRGSWALMTGLDGASKGAVTFLVDTALVDTASPVRKKLGPRTSFTNRPVFSGDGQHLFYWQCADLYDGERRRRNCHLYHLDLRHDDLRPATIPLPYGELGAHRMAFSDDGSKLALWRGLSVIVFEVGGRELWRLQLPEGGVVNGQGIFFFRPSGDLTVVRHLYEDLDRDGRAEIQAEVLGLAADREPERRALFAISYASRHRTSDGLLLGAGDDDGWPLRSLDGRVVHRLESYHGRRFDRLADGRLALLARGFASGRSAHLEIYDPPELPGHESRLAGRTPIEGWAFFGGQPAEDRLLVGVIGEEEGSFGFPAWGKVPTWSGLRTFVIDTREVAVVRVIEDFIPLPMPRPPGALGSDWLLDERGFPHRLDHRTGAIEPVLKR